MVTMLTDHIGAVLLGRIVYYRRNLEQAAILVTSQRGDTLYWLWRMLRTVGRIAFPIYCFLLVEGFLHTRDWHRYWLRMAAFAPTSEVPFRLAVWNMWAEGSGSVYVELAIGLLVLRGLRQNEGLTQPHRTAGIATVIGGGYLAAMLLKADYNMDEILIILLFYLLREKRIIQVMSGGILSLLEFWNICYEARIPSAVPLYSYSGKKGQTPWKYAFYWFYPLRLTVLFFIRLHAVGIPLR